MPNEIVLENEKQGNPESEWGLPNGASSNIEGFATDISTDVGGTVQFKINTNATDYRLEIYRVGYYNGDGARLVGTIQHHGAEIQPAPIIDLTRATADAGNWAVTDSWTVPSDAVSGVYIAKLVREDGTAGENHIPFIIRDDDGHSDIVFQTSDTTWQAYNNWGGASLYQNFLGTGTDAAFAVSYNRPVSTTTGNALFSTGEYSAIRWLEANGYDVSYIAGVDTARSGSELLEHKLFLSVGHDEYWSGDQRANVEAARDAGVNLAFWSGNEVWWKTRWESSLDSTPDAYRTLVTYKESHLTATDPSPEWTGTWGDPLNPVGAAPSNALTGTLFAVNSYRTDSINVSSDYSKLLFWANTDIAHLQPGESIQLAPGTLGYEWDVDADNGFRPAGLINLSSTTIAVDSLTPGPNDLISTSGNATHSLTLYRAPSGALVFGAGTVFWAWALDSNNPGRVQADPNVEQAMVNLLAQMGIQPETLKEGFIPGVQSTDHIAPQSTIYPLSGSLSVGSQVAIAGTATDFGGGVVAGVEFSGDGGATWHKATGTQNWNYTWTPDKIGLVNIEARAVDDSLNLEHTASANVFVDFQHSGFDPGYYLAMNPDVKAAGVDPYEHYITYGWTEGRDPNALFSTNLYLAANPDVEAAGVDPLTHFEAYGWEEGRNPSPGFDVRLYTLNNPDVASAGENPLDHYLVYGQAQGVTTYAAMGRVDENGFSREFYEFRNPDVAAAGVDPYQHYLLYGAEEGRNPNPYFDTKYYLAQNPDVAAAGVNPLEHYETYGWHEGRDPSAQFNTDAYLAANPDVAAADVDPLYHYIMYGVYEGRDPDGTTVTT